MAKSIMIQGTMSNAGKSVIAAALCRIFRQDGYRAAPFKSQNMALNSYVTDELLEMGRAQAMQAQAAGVKPSVLMNPILLKPTGAMKSQVIVNGAVMGDMSAADYFKRKREFIPDIMNAYRQLEREYDIIVIEGAGSPAEINLKENDIVNMGMAKMADAPVLLVGDIDRGGVFAQLYGTVMLLDEEERRRIKGIVINKFRGDKEILRPGLDMIEQLTGIGVSGVVPYGDFKLEDEDSLSPRLLNKTAAAVDIAVIRLPYISNFTDMNVFEFIDGVSVRYVSDANEIGEPDMIIIPGSKSTVPDLMWMRSNGIENAVKNSKCPIFGICGGYQMLGKSITDEDMGTYAGMGLLDVETVFKADKKRARVSGTIADLTGILEPLNGSPYHGYEIHMGESRSKGGAVVSDGNVYGTYIHGIFDKCAAKVVECICRKKGIDHIGGAVDIDALREREFDRLADLVRNNIDMELVYNILS